MIRKIIKIDEDKCNGCGLCVNACHEGALKLINGKAKLISESYCDGLGDCLPECPEGAIKIEEREAEPYDEEAVKKLMEAKKNQTIENLVCGCPGTHARTLEKQNNEKESVMPETLACGCPGTQVQSLEKQAQKFDNYDSCCHESMISQLRQWPVQIKLVPVNAPYFYNAQLLIAADCTAYAYANIHNDFMKNKVTLIGCPKLDSTNYAEKLTEILKSNQIKSITVLRMEVPCCSGLSAGVKNALEKSGKILPWRIVVIRADGTIAED